MGEFHKMVVQITANNRRRNLSARKQRETIDAAGDKPVISKICKAFIIGGIR
jgi:hypothetical protein